MYLRNLTQSLVIAVLMTIFSPSIHAGKVIYAKGKVLYSHNKKLSTIKTGDTFEEGSYIKTGKDALAVLRGDHGSTFKLGPNSQIKVKYLKEKKKTEVSLFSGEAFFKVLKKLSKSEESKFKVKTRTSSFGVRGTTFFVSYGTPKNNEDVWMCVKEGEVLARSHKTEARVKAGEGVSVKKGSVSTPKPLKWTEKLNWNFNPNKKLDNDVSIEEAYRENLLQQEY